MLARSDPLFTLQHFELCALTFLGSMMLAAWALHQSRVRADLEYREEFAGRLHDALRSHFYSGTNHLREIVERGGTVDVEAMQIAFDPDSVGERERQQEQWKRDDRRSARERSEGDGSG